MLTSDHGVSKQIIKPSLPTPTRLKRYNLSLMDQFSPSAYISVIFHYPNYSDIRDSIEEKSRCLKNSLSDTLTQYYPLAGRLDSTGSYIDCNDEGIEFQDVDIECQLSEYMEKPEHELRDLIYPRHDYTYKHYSALLVVKVHHFQCGGVLILVCLYHKLGDATSFVTFMKSWAVNTRRISNNLISNHEQIMEPPHFISYPNGSIASVALLEIPWTTRKFVFPNSEITKLKGRMDDSCMSATTRVEAVASLLFERAIATASSRVDFVASSFALAVNMRGKIIPPLPETSIGNLICLMGATISNSDENNLKEIVKKIKAAKVELRGTTKLEDMVSRLALYDVEPSDNKLYYCSSFCRMPFYEIDFGWGNPCRVTLADTMTCDVFFLMDTPTGDGIEAIVSLDEHHMTVFQNDQQILAYTTS